jgi:hypothetical protein
MPAATRRIAASLLVELQSGGLVITAWFALGEGNLTAGRLYFFGAFIVALLGVLILYRWLPALIVAAVLCGSELILGGLLLLVSVAVFGALGLVADLLTVAAPLIPGTILAIPTLILLGSLLWPAVAGPRVAPRT